MEAKRARRIRDKKRMKAKAVRVFADRGINNPNNIKLADHIAHCSGPCCGNPRRHAWFKGGEGLTMQERRFACVGLDLAS